MLCDEKFHQCLEFHHLNPSEKDLTVSTLINYGSLNRVKKEISKCVLLCANCHRKVHYDEQFDINMRGLIIGSQTVSKTV